MRLTIRDVQKMKDSSEPIPVITAYDAFSARASESVGIPMILVGDTLGMVVQGHDTTIPVTMEHMIYHCSIVSRVTDRALIIGDMPFMSYAISEEQAVANAARLTQEGGVGCVKLEGGEKVASTVKRIVDSGIPVMGHIGLTPQSINQLGGFRVQGKRLAQARQLIRDAEAIQAAGAFAIVLELVPSELSRLITEKLRIPTIGIGSGPHTDGQVQVFHDLLALFEAFVPRHTKRYANAGEIIRDALSHYRSEVLQGGFPTEENSFSISEEVIATLRAEKETGFRAGFSFDNPISGTAT